MIRNHKSYAGELMLKGRKAEEVVFEWLRNNQMARNVIDMRDVRVCQRLDVDCGIEDIHNRVVLAEIKSDAWLGKSGNVLFELFRVNHFVAPYHYLGWGWRSPAEKLLYYSSHLNCIYSFNFVGLRKRIGEIICSQDGATTSKMLNVTMTDNQKTTFNLLIPESKLVGTFSVFRL